MRDKYDWHQVRLNNPIIDTVKRLGVKTYQRKFCCVIPGHDDKNPSVSVFKSDRDGTELWHCQACKQTGDVIQLVELARSMDKVEALKWLEGEAPTMDPNKPTPKPQPSKADPVVFAAAPVGTPLPPAHRAVEHVWTKDGTKIQNLKGNGPVDWVHVYRNYSGEVDLAVLRWDAKDGREKLVRPIRWSPETNKWHAAGWAGDEPNRPLYNWDYQNHAGRTVVVVEGEKCADVVQPILGDRFLVVTWQGGAQNILRHGWKCLAAMDVILWPDNDEPGKEAMQKLARHLAKSDEGPITHKVRMVEPPADKPKGWDIADAAHELREAAKGSLEQLMLSMVVTPPPAKSEQPSSRDVGPTVARSGGEYHWLPAGLVTENNKNGDLVKNSLVNTKLYLTYHPDLKGRLSFDEFKQEVHLDGAVLEGVRDLDFLVEMTAIKSNLTLNSRTVLTGVLSDMAISNKKSSMRDLLRGLPAWDQVKRLQPEPGTSWGLLFNYCKLDHAPDAYNTVIGARWLVGAVRRAMEPGCQHDAVLILEGDQGVGKTSFFRTLGDLPGMNVYGETNGNLGSGDKDNVQDLRGKLLVELSEMTAHRKSEAGALKGFLSRRVDTIRPSYGVRSIDLARQCVFAGTTNLVANYLTDPTGSRRFWPVRVLSVDLERLRADLVQIWAEAVALYDAGYQNYLTKDEEAIHAKYIEHRETVDPWEVNIDEFLEKNRGDIHDQDSIWMAVNVFVKDRNRAGMERLTTIMDKRGFALKRGGGTDPANRVKAWRRNKLRLRPRA